MIDQNAAVSAGNIATAMQQVSASAQQAGLDIDTTMGYISTIADVSQKDPSSIGSSLRTIISRYGTVKAGAFSGMGTDNTGDDLENINDIEKVLRKLGISIRTSTMEFKSLDSVLDEVADHWMEYSSVERNAIATAFAGTRQRESFLILMANMEKAHKLTAIAAESHGMAELKYQAYLESTEAATKRLQNAWEGLTNSFETSDFLRDVKNFVSWLVENLSTIVSLIGSIMVSSIASNKIGSLFNQMRTNNKGFFGQLWGNIKTRVGGDINRFKDFANGEDFKSFAPKTISLLQQIVDNTAAKKATEEEIKNVNKEAKEEEIKSVNNIPSDKNEGDNATPSVAILDDKNSEQQNNGESNSAPSKEEAKDKNAKKNKPKQHRAQKAVQSAVTGLTTGITQGLVAAETFKNSDGGEASNSARNTVGWMTGGTAGLATLGIGLINPALGLILGPMIGTAVNKWIAPLIGNLIDQDKIARRERSQDAQKTYDTIKSIQTDTQTLKELSQSGAWSFDQYQKASSVVENMISELYGNMKAGRVLYEQVGLADRYGSADSWSDAEIVRYIKEYFSTYLTSPERREEIVEAWEAALATAEVNAFVASKEEEQYQNTKTLYNNILKGIDGNTRDAIDEFIETNDNIERISRKEVRFDGEIEERLRTEQQLLAYLEGQGKDSTDFYKILQKDIANISTALSTVNSNVDEMNTKRVKAAAIPVLNQYNTAQLKTLGIEGIAQEILASVNKQGGIFNSDGTMQYKYNWTGSLDTLAAPAKEYIMNYIKSNPVLYGIEQGTSYTLEEVLNGSLGAKGAKKRENYISSFAGQLGISVDELVNNVNNLNHYKGFTLGDISQSFDNLKSTLESINGLINSITQSGHLSLENMTTIISKYPKLINQAGDSVSLMKGLIHEVDVLNEAQTQNIIDMIGENEELFKEYKESISSLISSDVYDKIFGSVNTGDSFYAKYLTLTDDQKKELGENYEEIGKLFEEKYNNISMKISRDTSYLDQYRSYLSKVYDLQIENLSAQKNAIEQINEQRQYENKLIDARNKLENARNEKHQVYREGVGFVFEADQEAVEEAQKELDKVEREKTTNQLETIITELQSQKSWLDNTMNREQFKALESMAKALGTDKNDGLWGAVVELEDMYRRNSEFISRGYTGVRTAENKKTVTDAEEKFVQSAEDYENLKKAYSVINKWKTTKNSSGEEMYRQLKDIASGASDTVKTSLISGENSYIGKLIGRDPSGLSEKEVGEAINNSSIPNRNKAITEALSNNISTAATNLLTAKNTLNYFGKTGKVTVGKGENARSANLDKEEYNNFAIDDETGEVKLSDVMADASSSGGKPTLGAGEREQAKAEAKEEIVKMLENGYGNFLLLSDGSHEDWLIGTNTYGTNYSTWDASLLPALVNYFDSVGYNVNQSMLRGDDPLDKFQGTVLFTGGTTIRGAHQNDIPGFAETASGWINIKNNIDNLPISTQKLFKIAYPSDSKTGWEEGQIVGYMVEGHNTLFATRKAAQDYIDDLNKGSWNKKEYKIQEAYRNPLIAHEDAINYSKLMALIDKMFADKEFIPEAAANQSNRLGSLFTKSGLSTISEVGPELFTTPGLSGTALIPQGSKVLPAEATRGLWQLGSMASQFVKPLQSMINDYVTNSNSVMSTDESTNIQTLNISLAADRGFDVDAFIQQLKALRAISKHNK